MLNYTLSVACKFAMAILSSLSESITLDSVGCFRSELSKACGENAASLRRWHGEQVQSGRLKEGRDFVRVRQSPDERYDDDAVFYFYEAVKLCKRQRTKKRIDLNLVNLDTLRNHGLTIADGQVVWRDQLKLEISLFNSSSHTTVEGFEASELNNLFSLLIPRQYNDTIILQRCTDGYIEADKLFLAVGRRWKEFENQVNDPSTNLGLYVQVLTSTPRLYTMPLVQKSECSDSRFRGSWIHPHLARRIIEEIDPVLVRLVELWETDLERRSLYSVTKSEVLLKKQQDLLEEALKVVRRTERDVNKMCNGFERFRKDQDRLHIFEDWNRKIQRHLEGKISVPLQNWAVLKQRFGKATRTRFPFVYIIISHSKQSYESPEVFYVGQSKQQPNQRFSSHDGVKSLRMMESYGYEYEIRYFESPLFQISGELDITERALQVALDPYWLRLNAEEHELLKNGKLLEDRLFDCLPTRNEIANIY